MSENKCPDCGSSDIRVCRVCAGCGHKQWVVKPENTRETDTPTWRWKERGKKQEE